MNKTSPSLSSLRRCCPRGPWHHLVCGGGVGGVGGRRRWGVLVVILGVGC
jgi:hypothetical protein